jgi:hypothetical protein
MIADGHRASKNAAERCPRAETSIRAKALNHTVERVIFL